MVRRNTMKIKKIQAVYFSAVGHTKIVVEKIAETMAEELNVPLEYIDFTLPKMRQETYSFGKDELVVFGTPTYAGRVPNKVLPFVQELFQGQGTPALAVVTFGNRNFDSSLTELKEEVSKNGFHVFGAGGFVCSHVFSEKIAGIRPDEEDKKRIEDFALKACKKLEKAEEAKDLSSPVIRDNALVENYYVPKGVDGQPAKFLKAKPQTDLEKCSQCGICAAVCPMGSINPEDISQVPGICIKCHACVRKCPDQAKFFDDKALLSHIQMLEIHFTKRREPEIYL